MYFGISVYVCVEVDLMSVCMCSVVDIDTC